MKNSRFLAAIMCVMAVANFASADTFGTGSNQFTIDFVPISGSTNPTSEYGIVNNDYRMGTYEITNGQWNKFTASLGIPVTGNPANAYDRSSFYIGLNVPTNGVSWYEAAQMVNWLNTSTSHQAAYNFTGTQGTSDYTLATWSASEAAGGTNLYRHKDAFYFLPTEDEWVKAAYWNGTTLQNYSNASIADLYHDFPYEPYTLPHATKWNYAPTAGSQPWDVGSGVEELNGTFDMMGNVWEWTENPYNDSSYGTTSNRGWRGGSFRSGHFMLMPSYQFAHMWPQNENDFDFTGFRVASVPKPALVVAVDIKPQSCPNPLNVKSKGILPVAILGTADVNVLDIDPASIQLAGVGTIRSSYEDVAGPISEENECECTVEGPDGYTDLTLKFETQAIVEALGEVTDGEEWILQLTGVLHDDTPIEGEDCIVIRSKSKPGK